MGDCLSTSHRCRWCWSQEEAGHQLAGELCPPLSELGGQLPRSEQLARELRPSFPKLGGSLCCRPRSSQEANSGRFGLCRTSSRTHRRQLCPVCPQLRRPRPRTRPQQLRSGPAELPTGGVELHREGLRIGLLNIFLSSLRHQRQERSIVVEACTLISLLSR